MIIGLTKAFAAVDSDTALKKTHPGNGVQVRLLVRLFGTKWAVEEEQLSMILKDATPKQPLSPADGRLLQPESICSPTPNSETRTSSYLVLSHVYE